MGVFITIHNCYVLVGLKTDVNRSFMGAGGGSKSSFAPLPTDPSRGFNVYQPITLIRFEENRPMILLKYQESIQVYINLKWFMMIYDDE